MAHVVKRTERHNCREEIAAVDNGELYFGSIIECSCSKQFIKRDDQRDGPWWAEHTEKAGA